MKNILGLGGSIHDFSACIIHNEKILGIEEERITRIRYAENSTDPCWPAIQYCLEKAKIDLSSIDIVVVNDDLSHILDKFSGNTKTYSINHHLAHLYSAYFTSSFKESAVLVVDGAGSKKDISNLIDETRETTSFYHVIDKEIKLLDKVYGTLDGYNPISKIETVISNSIGEFYRVVSEIIGLGWLTGPGKMMGMASYGAARSDDRYAEKLRKTISLLSKGKFEIRSNGDEGLLDTLFSIKKEYENEKDIFQYQSALANSTQIIFEELIIHCLDHLYNVTKSENLCIVGGAALNSICNGKLLKSTKFKNLHVVPYPGDNGLAIGSAIWGHEKQSSEYVKDSYFTDRPYLSYSYTSEEILASIKDANIPYSVSADIYVEAAKYLAEGKVIAWYQDGSEFGPRALGNRSILADPRNQNIRDKINKEIKDREWFRPLAPAILDYKAQQYFDICGDINQAKWMQMVADVKEEYREALPGITHIDGSARVQVVSKKDNKKFFSLIENFFKITNLPIILNTSFNIKGEPIVETPQEAINAFMKSKIDVLILDTFVIVNKYTS